MDSRIYHEVRPRKGGRYPLFCYTCRRWIPSTANHEMQKEGVYAHGHFCYIEDGKLKILNEEGVLDKEGLK